MSKKTKIALVAGGLLVAGAVAAVSAPGHRMGHGGPGEGGWGMRMGGPMGGMHGFMMGGGMGDRMGERIKALDANKDGAVTLDEALARSTDAFGRMDKNKDGAIDKSDVDALAQENADYWARRMIKARDTDKDGKISKDEAAKSARDRSARADDDDDDDRDGRRHMRGHMRGDMSGRLDRRFDRIDKNSDGFIDKAEIEAYAADRRGNGSDRFLRRFDADKDGKVTRQEFEAPARERFAANDLDDDGRITDAELPPMLRGRGYLK